MAVGVMGALRPDDAVVATYRDHGHALARGIPAGPLLAEMFGRVEGVSRGRGGSMHLFDAATRFYGGNAIVGGGLPVAVGLALADQLLGRDRVTACFFGEGAVAEGEFHETMNLARLWDLPVLFAARTTSTPWAPPWGGPSPRPIWSRKAEAYALTARAVDGMDVMAVAEAARQAVDEVRSGTGPVFLELKTYRFRAHSMYDPERYRAKAEVEDWKARDPIPRLQAALVDAGTLDDDALAAIEADIAAEIDAAVAFAEAGTLEPVADLTRFVHSEAAP